MENEFICARTGGACDKPELCAPVNKPLQNAVPRIFEEVEGSVQTETIRTKLINQLNIASENHKLNLDPNLSGDNLTICPVDGLEWDWDGTLGQEHVEVSMTQLVEVCISRTVQDIEYNNKYNKPGPIRY